MNVFLGSLMLVPYNFAPRGYAFCQGQVLPISQNTALFSLLGTIYGGNGTSTFGLPNLQGALAVNQGQGPGLSNYNIGQTGGSPSVTLQAQSTPSHTHQPQGVDPPVANSSNPTNGALGKPSDGTLIYATATAPLQPMNPGSVQNYGTGQPHNNMMPYLVLNWIIALQGIFPSRS
jgi:microcystin-dependent protein